MTSKNLRRYAPALAAALSMVFVLAGGASSASAAIILGAGPNIPTPNGSVVVGQSYPSSLRLINNSDDQQSNDPITLDTITLVPSCGVVASVECPPFGFGGDPTVTAFDPDVFELSATGTGRAGTACGANGGQTFNITNIDQSQDQYEFQPVGGAVVLQPPNGNDNLDECIIDFTARVLKVPTKDAKAADGIQTNELAGVNGTSQVDGQVGSGDGSNFTTVNKATPDISTSVNEPARQIGQSFTDTATVTGTPNVAQPTGSVTFAFFAPGDANCATPLALTPEQQLAKPLSNEVPPRATSEPFTVTMVGRYRVIATYGGDTNYAPVSGICGEDNENVDVTRATPDIDTMVSNPARQIGQSFTDTATVRGVGNIAQPTGSVTFAFFAPGDAACATPLALTPEQQLAKALSNEVPPRATSEPFTVTQNGRYRVIATYGGDTNYAPVSGICGEDNENVDVTPPPDIVVDKTVTPASQPLPSGDFTFTVRVTNPGPETIEITGLTDTVYGNIGGSATGTGPEGSAFTSSTCPSLIGDMVAPGAQSDACTFVGTFESDVPDNEIDTVTARGVGFTSRIPVEDDDDAEVELVPRQPQIAVVKDPSPETRQVPGGEFTFTVRVSNPGNVPIVITSLRDNVYGNIENVSGTGPPPRQATFRASTCATLIGDTLQPGAQSDPCSFIGTFTNPTPAQETDIVTVIGRDEIVPPGGATVTDNDDATVRLTPVPTTPPPPPPPVAPPPPAVVAPPPPPPPAAQGVAPEAVVPRGVATISGKTGCQGTPFNVVVSGRQIQRVIFTMDGKVVRSLRRPNSGSRYKLAVNPRTMPNGTHRVLARVIYNKASGSKNRTLRVAFSKCARRASRPAFTG